MPQQKSVSVTIDKGKSISVDNPKVSVNKNSDTVQWTGNGPQEFNIVFKGGGGAKVTCALDPKTNNYVCTSDTFANTTGVTVTHKYNVTSSGTPTLDPDVEVFP